MADQARSSGARSATPTSPRLKDINAREWIVLGVFAAGVLALGIYPKPLTDLMEPSIAQLASQLAATKL